MSQKHISKLQLFVYRCISMMLGLLTRTSDYIVFPVLSTIRSALWKSSLPPIDDRILLMSATELAEKIRTQQLTSETVVTTFVRRLRKINPILNAVTDERYRAALEDARNADSIVASCAGDPVRLDKLRETKPFLGVPVTTKNALAVKDLGHESGLYIRRGLKANEDSTVMSSVRQSGAIPLAVTNTPELCLWLESRNKLFGVTSNPYDTRRTCGGSSGGEGAILAACGSPFGVGTDIAGSVRIPSFYNGLFGLKPSKHLVDTTGHYPMAKDILSPLLTAGPMCKHACDLRPLLAQIVGPENAQRLALHEKPKLVGHKVYFMEDSNCNVAPATTQELRKCTVRAAEYLAQLTGSTASELPEGKVIHRGMANTTPIYLSYFAKAKIPSFAEELTLCKGRIAPGRELIKWLMGLSKHSFPAVLVTMVEKLIEGKEDSPLINHLFKLSQQLEDELGELLKTGILVTPTLPDVAPFHGLTMTRPGILGVTGIWNILGFPAMSVPMGLNSRGVPMGVTIVAGKMQDNLCCEIALEMEKKFGGWVPPCEVQLR